jgi:predicted permease
MLDHRSSWFLNVIGRRGSGITVEQTAARLAHLSEGVFAATVPPAWDTEGQSRYLAYEFTVKPSPSGLSDLRERYAVAIKVLMAVVGIVLLIACGNLANLMMARATQRSHEVAIRRAIGSSRTRLVRQLVTESLLLSLSSTVVAVVFASWASSFLVTMISPGGYLWLDLSLDLTVLGFTVAAAALTGVVFGLAPAWQASRVAPQAAMRTAGRSTATRRGRYSSGKVLVVGQLALSLNLVVGAGLLLGTLTRLLTVDTGFNRKGLLVASINIGNAGYSPREYSLAHEELLQRMRALPGVLSASAAQVTPFGGSSMNNHVEVDGFTPAMRDETLVWYNFASEAFFETMETPLLAGRDFDSHDAPGQTRVAVINEAMANRFFNESQPLGRHFRMKAGTVEMETVEVIGVVADTKHSAIEESAEPKAYFALSQRPYNSSSLRFQLRTNGAPTSLIPAVTDELHELHPRISVRFSTLDDQVAASLTRPKLLAVLSGFFGAVALLLAMIGLYGTLAYQVANRRNEIGVRLALGAARSRLLGMVFGEVGRMVFFGLVLGVALTFVTTRFVASLLFGVTAMDPMTLLFSVGVLAFVAVAAGTLPAWRAARLDPMRVIRQE